MLVMSMEMIVGTASFGMTRLTGSQRSMWLRCSAVMDFMA